MDVEAFLEYLENMQGPCTDFCLKCPAQGYLHDFYDIVKDIYHENQLLSSDNSRLVNLCQELLDKINVCAEALKDVSNKTYIFRRTDNDD